VVIVVAREEDNAPSLHLALQEVEERLGLLERVLDGREQEIEDVAEQDDLVDLVELRREPLQGELVRQERIARPGAEMHVGDRERPHR
jgi:hypothetical protein